MQEGANLHLIEAREHFNYMAPFYDDYSVRRDSYLKGLDLLICERLRRLSPCAHLDVGCGTGRLMNLVRAQGLPVVSEGIDLSPQMVQLCRAQNLHVTQSDFLSLEREAAYDLITMEFNVFGYLAAQYSVGQVLRHAKTLLRPGGSMIFDFVNPFCLTSLASSLPGTIMRLMERLLSLPPYRVRYYAPPARDSHPITFLIPGRKQITETMRELNFSAEITAVEYGGESDHPYLPSQLKSNFVVIGQLTT
jgi:SAM-dependent methyltransferase